MPFAVSIVRLVSSCVSSSIERPIVVPRVLYRSVQVDGRCRRDRDGRWRCRNGSRSRETFPDRGDVDGSAGRDHRRRPRLGELIAHAFSTAGAKVALVARTERDLKEVADALPGPTLVFAGDVRDADFNEAVADGTVAEWGGVDVWICNAGISPIVAGPLDDRSGGVARRDRRQPHRRVPRRPRRGPGDGRRRPADLHRLGARRTSARGPHRRTARPRPGWSGMAKGLALDLAPAGITVNVVAPGLVRVAARRRLRQQRAARRVDPRPHGACGGGASPPTSPAPSSSSPPTPPRSSPGPCITRRRRVPARMSTHGPSTSDVIAILGAGRRRSGGDLGSQSRRRARHRPRAQRRERAVAAGDDRRPRARDRVETVLADVTDIAQVEAVVAPRRRTLRAPRRADQQRRRARAERPDPQPDRRRLGAGRSGINLMGSVNAVQAAVRADASRRGRVRSSSPPRSPGITAWSHAAPYCATKAGGDPASPRWRRSSTPATASGSTASARARSASAIHADLPQEAIDAMARQAPARPRCRRRPRRRLLVPRRRRLPLDDRLGPRRRRRLLGAVAQQDRRGSRTCGLVHPISSRGRGR